MNPRLAVLLLGALGCGTIASPGEADRDLPNNRTGPFRPLTLTETSGQECVVTDPHGALDEPSAVRLPDGTVAVYATRRVPGRTGIARTVLRGGVLATGPLTDVFAATQPWEGAAVASPAVVALAGGGYAMAYVSQGSVGIARSADSVAWTAAPAPVLTADPGAGEAATLEAPSLVVDGAGSAALAYASGGSLWLARAPAVGGPYARVDAVAATPVRDPVLAPDTPPDGGVDFASGALGDPSLTLDETSAGRALWRLYFTARATVGIDAGVPARSIGMAAAFDGVTFQRVGAPVYAPRTGNVAAPSILARDAVVTLLYVGADCSASGDGRGIQGAVAPVTVQLGAP